MPGRRRRVKSSTRFTRSTRLHKVGFTTTVALLTPPQSLHYRIVRNNALTSIPASSFWILTTAASATGALRAPQPPIKRRCPTQSSRLRPSYWSSPDPPLRRERGERAAEIKLGKSSLLVESGESPLSSSRPEPKKSKAVVPPSGSSRVRNSPDSSSANFCIIASETVRLPPLHHIAHIPH